MNKLVISRSFKFKFYLPVIIMVCIAVEPYCYSCEHDVFVLFMFNYNDIP